MDQNETAIVSQAEATQNEPSNNPSETRQRKGRSGTRLKSLSKSRKEGKTPSIQFDRNWRPTGANKAKYVSFVGLLARSKPPITVETWDAVDERVKNQIWDCIRLTYDNVPDNQVLKERTLSYCGERWRAFKTHLACKYVHKDVVPGMPPPNPCEKYQFLDSETWQEFIRIRTTEKAKEKRAKAKENASKNDCPHTMSRGGYAKAEEDMMALKRQRREEQAESEPSVLTCPPSPIRREDKWLYAHKKRSGAFTSEHAREIADKINELKEQEAQGSFMSQARNDILIVATGKQEHGGRVRGVGRGVGIREYFGAPPRHPSNVVPKDEVERLLAAVRAEARAEAQASVKQLKEEMMSLMGAGSKQQLDQLGIQTQSPTVGHQSTKGSCVVGHGPEDPAAPEQGDHCDLYVEDPTKRLVAHGAVHNLGATVHNMQLADDQVRVSVEEVIIDDALVPIPTDEVKTVGQAKNMFIRWPKHLVSDRGASSPPKNAPRSTPPSIPTLPSPMSPWLQTVMLAYGNQWQGSAPVCMKSVVGEMGVPAWLNHEDLASVIIPNRQFTDGACQVFLMYIHQELLSSGKKTKYGLLCPQILSGVMHSENEMHQYAAKMVTESADGVDCFFAPYIDVKNNHWQLFVLCKKTNKVVFLCSLHSNDPGEKISRVMTSVMRTVAIATGKVHAGQVQDPQWIKPKSHRQPERSNLCGLYVIRHIVDIIATNKTTFTEKTPLFKFDEPFPDDDIQELRHRFAEFFVKNILHKQNE